MKRIPLPWLIVAGLVILLVATTCGSRRALAERDERVDSLRTETLTARAQAMGWQTQLVNATANLEARLQEAVDSTDALSVAFAALARENELLGGRLALAAEVVASMQGQIEASAAVVHQSDLRNCAEPQGAAPCVAVEQIDSITGDVSDGLLSAHVRATVEPPTVAIPSYSIELAIALGLIDAPDGRALVTARAADPRVALTFGEVYWAPPPPVNYCGLGTRVKDHGRGYAVGRAIEFALSQALRRLNP